MTRRLTLIVAILFALLAPANGLLGSRGEQQTPAAYERLRAEAEVWIAEGSFARAQTLYGQARAMELPDDERRWVDFRIADTMWRANAGSNTADTTIRDDAHRQLLALVRDINRIEDRDLVWAWVHESLGDLHWTTRQRRNQSTAFQHYRQALDWWAGARDIDTARRRYLDMLWRMAEVEQSTNHRYFNQTLTPTELENATRIAMDLEDRARAHFLYALALQNQGRTLQQRNGAADEFKAVLDFGTKSDWHDDALYFYAEWLQQQGPYEMREDGGWYNVPDYRKAVSLYRRLLAEHRKGETPYYDDAQRRIEQITKPELQAGVSNIFLPGSEIQYHTNWRNVERIEFTLHRVDLCDDKKPRLVDDHQRSWIDRIDVNTAKLVRSWHKDTGDTGEHVPGSAQDRLEEPLPAGAYVLTALANGQSARELVLVTNLAVVLKTSDEGVLAYVCDAQDGSPVAGAQVRTWATTYDRRTPVTVDAVMTSDEQGLCMFERGDLPLPTDVGSCDLFVAAKTDVRQAMVTTSAYRHSNGDHDQWRVFAFTDRPAYRPGETVQFKYIARAFDASGRHTPRDASLQYEIFDPQGSKISEDVLDLNTFGSAWGELELTTEMPLGEYRVSFHQVRGDDRRSIGGATLFRLEEYKLPEFRVSVSTPEEDGRPKAFRLGDIVEAQIDASYYFGGAVASANVEVVISQRPFYHWWRPPHEFPWCYETQNPYEHWYYHDQIVKRETLKTDAEGRVLVSFETPYGSNQDYEYRIEARVTDSSRREIVGSGKVRVTRQRYYVYANPAHNLYRPHDEVEVSFKALDANQSPVQITGKVVVMRDEWVEVWIDPTGRELKGQRLAAERRRHDVFPPPVEPGNRPWRLKMRGYQTDEILRQSLTTDDAGEAMLAFTPTQPGYYRCAWTSDDPGGMPVQASTLVWVTTADSHDIGYRHGGLQIIADKDTFHAGQTAPVMIVTPARDRHVLFSIEGNHLHDWQLVHVTGTVKLLQLNIEERHEPNAFFTALMVHDAQIYMDNEQIVVPPAHQYLDVELQTDRTAYQPGEQGEITIVTRDRDGRPVSAEVALSVADESVYYIQSDYAGDPRPFFFEQRQSQRVGTATTFQWKRFVKLAQDPDGQLVDDKRLAELQLIDGLRNEESEGEEYRMRRDMAQSSPGRGGGGLFDAPADSVRAKKSAGPMAPAVAESSMQLGMDMDDESGGAGGPAGPAVEVRSDFRSTLFWKPDIITNEHGVATVDVEYADSLTSWNAKARVATTGGQFGFGEVTTKTRKPLIVRLQAPRFFVAGDRVTISAILNNNTDEPMQVNPTLEMTGLLFASPSDATDGGDDEPSQSTAGRFEVPAQGEQRVDWIVTASEHGEAALRVTAMSDEHADAMEKLYPVFEHGIEKYIAKAGKVRGDEVAITIDIPSERRDGSTTLAVQVTPSMAVTMLDALPYLVDYPYGCTEQTMSRFLPTVITARTLADVGMDPADGMSRIFGGIEREHAAATHTKKKHDLRKVNAMTSAGLNRLYDFQHGDGGWGWWKEGDSDRFMTAYVLWGMTLAKQADVDVRGDVMQRAARFLEMELVEVGHQHDLQAWVLHALAMYGAVGQPTPHPEYQAAALQNLWQNKAGLNAYTRALLALTVHAHGDAIKAETLVRNLENGVKRDEAPDTSVVMRGGQHSNDAVIGTAHWGADGISWRWSEGGVEATAFALRALLAIDPDNDLIEPVTNWLIKNRRGSQWSNTRDTAIVVLALNDFLRVSGELSGGLEYELLVNGQTVANRSVSASEALSAPSRFEINEELIRDGANEIVIRRVRGDGPIYFAATATYFSHEDPIPPAGSEVFARREYFKLVPRETLLKGVVYDRLPLEDGGDVNSGERVEVVMTIETKNNLEYLVFEDLKPAGLEAVQIRSGEAIYARELKTAGIVQRFGNDTSEPAGAGSAVTDRLDYTGRQRWIYQELRDRKVALFIDRLPEGVWEIRYDLRAETPGAFHALPVMGHAMYVPEIRCNGAETRLTVHDDAPGTVHGLPEAGAAQKAKGRAREGNTGPTREFAAEGRSE